MSRLLSIRIQFAIAVCLGGLLIIAGVQHLRNPHAFLAAVLRYQFLPHDLAVILSASLPSIQVALGTTLIIPETRRPALAVAGMLFGCFAAAQAYALILGLDIGCGCFGPSYDHRISMSSTMLVLAFAFLAFAGLMLGRKRDCNEPSSNLVPTSG